MEIEDGFDYFFCRKCGTMLKGTQNPCCGNERDIIKLNDEFVNNSETLELLLDYMRKNLKNY